jgi:hypothetical protein
LDQTLKIGLAKIEKELKQKINDGNGKALINPTSSNAV